MIKNIVFDIGNVILNFDLPVVLPKFTKDSEEQKFIIENIINSPEWMKYGLIDTGYITKEEAISIVQDRTNHSRDELIYRFWNEYNDYCFIDENILDLIKKLKMNDYNVYLLSNINKHTCDKIKSSGLFEIVDGSILSYQVHKIKPYIAIYEELINKYNLDVKNTLFIDDNINNINTAINIGMNAIKVIPNNYRSVLEIFDCNTTIEINKSIISNLEKGDYNG